MDTAEIVTLKTPVTERDHAAGPANAIVTLVEYGNFECLDCGRTYPVIKHVRNILKDYLRFVYRHFPMVNTHPHSLRAAEAAESAAEQGKFWEMHDELFSHQKALEEQDLSHYARRIGLDVERFTRAMSEHIFLAEIKSEYQRSLFEEHITGTPTIYLNGIRYSGWTDQESLLAAIKQSDPEGRILLPGKIDQLRHVIDRFRHGSKN